MQKSFTETRPFFLKGRNQRNGVLHADACPSTCFLPRTQHEISGHIPGPLWRDQVSQKEEATPSKRWNKAARGWGAQGTSRAVHGRVHSSILNVSKRIVRAGPQANTTLQVKLLHSQARITVPELPWETGEPATVSNPQSFGDTHPFPRILASWVLNYIR